MSELRFCCSFRMPALGGSWSTVGAHRYRCKSELKEGLDVNDINARERDCVHAGIAFSGMWRMVGAAEMRKSRMSWVEVTGVACWSGGSDGAWPGRDLIGFCSWGGGGLSIQQ